MMNSLKYKIMAQCGQTKVDFNGEEVYRFSREPVVVKRAVMDICGGYQITYHCEAPTASELLATYKQFSGTGATSGCQTVEDQLKALLKGSRKLKILTKALEYLMVRNYRTERTERALQYCKRIGYESELNKKEFSSKQIDQLLLFRHELKQLLLDTNNNNNGHKQLVLAILTKCIDAADESQKEQFLYFTDALIPCLSRRNFAVEVLAVHLFYEFSQSPHDHIKNKLWNAFEPLAKMLEFYSNKMQVPESFELINRYRVYIPMLSNLCKIMTRMATVATTAHLPKLQALIPSLTTIIKTVEDQSCIREAQNCLQAADYFEIK